MTQYRPLTEAERTLAVARAEAYVGAARMTRSEPMLDLAQLVLRYEATLAAYGFSSYQPMLITVGDDHA